MKLDHESTVLLTGAILKQAVDDYRMLISTGRECIQSRNSGDISRTEIEKFFETEWSESLIQDGLSYHCLCGSDLLKAAIS